MVHVDMRDATVKVLIRAQCMGYRNQGDMLG